MTWRATTLDEFEALISVGLHDCTAAQRTFLDTVSMKPRKWRLSPWGDPGGGFWVVAIHEDRVLWFNDIEDGFNVSRFSREGEIPPEEYWCDQDSLRLPATNSNMEAGRGAGHLSRSPVHEMCPNGATPESKPLDPFREPVLKDAPALLFVEWSAPILTMRVDLVPLEFQAGSASVLCLDIDAPDLASSALESVCSAVGFACEANWPNETGAAELEIYLNYAADPVEIRSPLARVKRVPYSPADLEAKVRYLRQLAAEHLADWWAESRELSDLRSRLRRFAERGIERSSRKLDFFARTDPALAQAMEARLRTFREALVLLDARRAGGEADEGTQE